MEKTVEAVGRVIETMRTNLGEPLTVDDMAKTVMFSKFHFSRFFQRVTGVSPGRFLSAMRLQEAKELLVTTSLTVTEISHRVGYTSVGTFSSRFTMSVGVSPTTYRQLGGFRTPATADQTGADTAAGTAAGTGADTGAGTGADTGADTAAGTAAAAAGTGRRTVPAPTGPTVCGEVRSSLPDSHLGLVFVGLFADPIPRGQPVRCAVLHRTGPFLLDRVPHGTWYLLAHSVAAGLEGAVSAASAASAVSAAAAAPAPGGAVPTKDEPAGERPDADQTICVGSYGPVRVGPDSAAHRTEVRREPMLQPDPAVLKALLDIRSVALTVGAS